METTVWAKRCRLLSKNSKLKPNWTEYPRKSWGGSIAHLQKSAEIYSKASTAPERNCFKYSPIAEKAWRNTSITDITKSTPTKGLSKRKRWKDTLQRPRKLWRLCLRLTNVSPNYRQLQPPWRYTNLCLWLASFSKQKSKPKPWVSNRSEGVSFW